MLFFRNIQKLKDDSVKIADLASRIKLCINEDGGLAPCQKEDLSDDKGTNKIIMFEQSIKQMNSFKEA